MNKFLVVYNFCGGRMDNINMWLNHIETIIVQKKCDFDLILSGCLISQTSKEILNRYISSKNINGTIFIDFIEELHPINVTFNHACILANKENGPYNGYLFMSSDICFKTENDFRRMFEFHIEHENAISNFIVDNENWIPTHISQDFWNSLQSNHSIFPFGHTINCDCVIFDGDIYSQYGKVIPDIFRSWCTESVFPFLAASINKNFMCHDSSFNVHHATYAREGSSLIASSGCEKGCDDLYRSKLTVHQRLLNEEAYQCGFGYAESHFYIHKHTRESKNNIYLVHNSDAYISDYKPKDTDRLVSFIKTAVFLTKEELDYDTISFELIKKM